MFQFTPLLGAQSSSPASQSLLELDGGVKVLIDVGWDEHFDVAKLKELEKQIPSLSIILLTHATPAHLAAFAHCCKHFPSFTQIPIYATSPVISLGRTLLQDIYSSTPLASTIIPQSSLSDTSYSSQSAASESLNILLQPPTSEEIASYFALIRPLKYSQPHQPLPSPFSPPLNDLTITAYNAGHTLGGTIWHIQHGMESIVYAVDWNQIRENVLAGAAWLGGSGGGGAEVIEQLRKPTALVCSARGAERNAMAGGRKKRDDLLLDMIRNTVSKGGIVLIPTETSARVLELAYVLEHAWRKDMADDTSDSPLKKTKLYLASRNVGATMRYARSMLEWMDENVVREFESESTNTGNRQYKRGDRRLQNQTGQNRDSQGSGKPSSPFDFKWLKLLESRKRIEKEISRGGSQVILASDTSLEWGFSRDILQRIAADPSSLIILTEDFGVDEREKEGEVGLSSVLWQWYRERRDGVAMEKGLDEQIFESVSPGGRQLLVRDAQFIPLEGKELLIYQQYIATRRQTQNLSEMGKGTNLESSADAVDETSSTSSSSEESDPERQGKALHTSAKTARFNRNKTELGKETIGVNVLLRKPGVFDYDVRGKKGREQMFPFVTKRRRTDGFGDLIKPEDYLRAEEREEVNGQDMQGNGAGRPEGLGKKRKWQDSGLQGDNGRRKDNGPNKRQQQGGVADNHVVTDETIEAIVNGHGTRKEDESSEESEAEPDETILGPSKVTFNVRSIAAHLRIAFVDFAGLHDQRSLSMLIPLIQPKKLILVGGNTSETSHLAGECRQKLKSEVVDENEERASFVFTPFIGETVNASVDTNAWTVKLSEALVRRFHWQNVRSLGVVTLMGNLSATSLDESATEVSKRKKLKMLDSDSEEAKPNDLSTGSETPELVPTLDVVPANMAAATRSVAQPLHVGDLRLADLRKILQSSGHTADFRGEGTLLIDGLVAVRKSGTGKIEVEGGGLNLPEFRTRSLEGSFYAVKRRIYDGLAVIAGG